MMIHNSFRKLFTRQMMLKMLKLRLISHRSVSKCQIRKNMMILCIRSGQCEKQRCTSSTPVIYGSDSVRV